jgi:predicted transcriptional regulator
MSPQEIDDLKRLIGKIQATQGNPPRYPKTVKSAVLELSKTLVPKEVANCLGISYSCVSKILSRERRAPEATLVKLQRTIAQKKSPPSVPPIQFFEVQNDKQKIEAKLFMKATMPNGTSIEIWE